MTVATRWPMVGRGLELEAFAAALRDPGCEGFCIYGPPGVGKTRLGDECLAAAEADRRRVMRATGEASTSSVPFAGIAHLLPARALVALSDDGGAAGEAVVRARMLEAARRALRTAPDVAGVPVLFLDDAHRLDGSSLSLLDDLLAEGALFCISTVVTGEAVPELITRWWRDERSTRIDLTPLGPVAVDTLLHVVLEGPLHESASRELWRASRGNMLALRELVLGASARRQLVSEDGVWQLTGKLAPPARLREVIEARFAGLAPEALAVLERLALCQPLALSRLEAAAGLAALEALERDGLIAVHNDGRRESVRLAHPLHGEVLRAGLPRLRARSILLAEAEAIENSGARRREDPLRIACWRLEATGRAEPELLLGGARLARFAQDYPRTVMLARAALAAEPSAEAGLVLGEALYNLGSFEEAEVALAAATERASGDAEHVRIATVRRRNLLRGCRRDAEALDVGRAAATAVVSDEARAELLAGEAEILAVSGRAIEALALLAQLPSSSPRVHVLGAIARASALATIGRTAEAISVSKQAYRDHLALGDELAISSPGTHRVNQIFALVQAGRLVEADEKGRAWFDVVERARNPLGVMWLGVHLARCALVQGRPVTVLRWTQRACTAIDSSGFEGLRPIVYSIEAVAYGLLGDRESSADRTDLVDTLDAGFGFLHHELALGRAWGTVAYGEPAAARDVLMAAAGPAARAGHVPAAAWLLHDAARLGGHHDAAPMLADLAAATDSVLVAARAEHAAALVANDGERLEAAGDRFATIGAELLAAEALCAAADVWRRRQDQRRAAALDVRVDGLLARSEGARTPALTRSRTVVPLTNREREIALLAAAGHPSRVIAERLYLSVRTVDNHLSRIYDKLGVSRRVELASALDVQQPEDGGR
jgi:DNA-binding CsgD family transcriptional regulator/tetratricopeptide (TPR) repeat protein